MLESLARTVLGNVATMLLPVLFIFPFVLYGIQVFVETRLSTWRQLGAFLLSLNIAALPGIVFGADVSNVDLTYYFVVPMIASVIGSIPFFTLARPRDGTAIPKDSLSKSTATQQVPSEPRSVGLFNYFVLTLFSEMYEQFPIQMDLDPVWYSTTHSPEGLEPVDYEHRIDVLASAIDWLIREGLLRCAAKREDGDFVGLELTASALTAFGSTPTSLKLDTPEETLAEKTKRILRRGAESASTELLQQLTRLRLRPPSGVVLHWTVGG